MDRTWQKMACCDEDCDFNPRGKDPAARLGSGQGSYAREVDSCWVMIR